MPHVTNHFLHSNFWLLIKVLIAVRSFDTDTVTYLGNHTPSIDNEAGNLGQRVLLTSTFRNGGPTTIKDATLTLYVPTRSSLTGDYYFYYPAAVVSGY